jgi:hypothetical protein
MDWKVTFVMILWCKIGPRQPAQLLWNKSFYSSAADLSESRSLLSKQPRQKSQACCISSVTS